MATVVNRTTKEVLYSVNTPDYDSADWVINPDLSSVSGVPTRYWKIDGDTISPMSGAEREAVDASLADQDKASKIEELKTTVDDFIPAQGYKIQHQQSIQSMYSDGLRMRGNARNYLQPWVQWLRDIDAELKNKIAQVQSEPSYTGIQSVQIETAPLVTSNPQITRETGVSIEDSLTLDSFLDSNVAVTGMAGDTGIVGPYYLIQLLNHRKELYNDDENPLYTEGHQPILGASGMLSENAIRVLNLENIHSKGGWVYELMYKANYHRPKDLLIYYGWPNSFNSAQNSWNNENVAQDMAKYKMIVLGDGVQDPSHGDYSNTEVIIPRVKALNPETLIFGYVTTDQSLANFKTKTDQWDDLEVDGILLDESGYDFGRTRSEFNERVDYVHGKTYSNIAFANAWNTDHILGTTNDPSYPNSTYNSSGAESNLTSTDWILLESFPINTTSYTNGFESASDWDTRGTKFQGLRNTYHVNFAGVGTISNDHANGVCLFEFGYISALMWSLEAYGTSDTSYGASSAAVKFWTRPDVYNLGSIWNLNASIQQDNGDSDKYHRYLELAKLTLDFSSGGETGSISRF